MKKAIKSGIFGIFLEVIVGIMFILVCAFCLIFSLLFIIIKGLGILVHFLRSLKRTKKAESPVKIIRQKALSVGEVQSLFFGVRVGEFIIRPDSSSEMRSEELRIIRGQVVIVVQGGSALLLRVWTKEGFSYNAAFQSQLSQDDKFILRELASDLAGWVWPDIGEVLRRRVEELGEDSVLRALRNLFDGVERTMRRAGSRLNH